MGLTSLQVCMDSSDWLQGTVDEETGMDSSSSPSGDMLTCSRPLIERRLRPPHDQALKCPRCDSTHTKFCYYNNYSLSQPRYFCKTCRRYWTKGGTLRNIPVGGGCRKNKKVSSKKSNDHQNTPQNLGSSSPILNNNNINPTDLHLSIFPDQMQQFSHHFTNILNPNNFMLENPLPIDFMIGSSSFRNHDFMENGGHDHHHMGSVSNCHDININSPAGIIQAQNFHNFCSPFGMYLDGNSTNAGQGEALMLPYETNHHHHHEDHQNSALDVKPNAKHLALEWHDQQGCSDVVGKDSFDYFNGVAGGSSWPGLMNGYGTSATNPSLV